jgi:lysyl endopeptidase
MKKTMFRILLGASMLVSGMAMAQIQGEGGQPRAFKTDGSNAAVSFVTMSPFNLDSMMDIAAQMDAVKGPYKFGYNHYTNFTATNSGTWETLPNGDRIWHLGIECLGATTINLAFNNFFMPVGARMFVYSEDHTQVLGAFTSTSNFDDRMFGTELIAGERVIIEYFEPVSAVGQGSFNLFRVTHGFRSTAPFISEVSRAFGDAGSCNNNVNCPGGASWVDQKRSVVCLVSGGSEFCTGALVNNTCNNGTPYVLTANHCGAADGSWVFRFNWESASCANPSSNPASQSLSGGTARASNANSDVHLCEINTVPPSNYNVYYAGWNRTTNPVDSVVAIHHPSGDIKKITWALNQTNSASWGGADCWQVGQWTSGVTEPGSSGSPLFDNNHRIIGQLYGGPSACGQPANQLHDFYGKFASSWNFGSTAATRLSDWLDPCNTNPQTLDGYDPNMPTQALDAQMTNLVSPLGNYSLCAGTQTENVVFVLRNAGQNALTSCTITWQVDNNPSTVYNWSGNLASSATANVTLGTLTLPVGTHTLTAVVSNPNNGTDGNAANNTTSGVFTLTLVPLVQPPLVEGFQTPTFPPTDWQLVTPNGVTWIHNTAVGAGSSSSMSINNFDNDTRNSFDLMQTMSFDFSNAALVQLSFDVAYARYSNQFTDSLAVLISSDCGVTWSQVYYKGGQVLATAPDNTNLFIPTTSQWRNEVVNLNAYAGQSGLLIAFKAIGGYGNMLYVDNINIGVTLTSPEIAAASNWSVFPNPSQTGMFTLDCSRMNGQATSYEVVNMLGETVANGQAQQTTTINLSTLAEGTYFLRVTTNAGVSTRKLMIAK